MFYAIEYAYGRHVVNNGPRADTVLEFTSRRLRDAWGQDGPPHSDAGCRDVLSARHPLVRKASWIEDGDGYGWRALGRQRVERVPALAEYRHELCEIDWPDRDHWKFVATDPEREIISWAEAAAEHTPPVAPQADEAIAAFWARVQAANDTEEGE